MYRRKKISRKKSRRMFTRTARKSNRRNSTRARRGGIRF